MDVFTAAAIAVLVIAIGFVMRRVSRLEAQVAAMKQQTPAKVNAPPAQGPVNTTPAPVPVDQPSSPVQVPPAERRREERTRDEWEALVGGNLLNKIGALVLVIGLALFLGYSFTRMSPGGRALTCITLSLVLLIIGVAVERKSRYQVFARGLIGAGWAGLYVTAYAIYSVPAAQVIHNPALGSFIVLLVAGGMILHSLHYRNQAVTGMAYFSAFAALAVSPWSTLAAIAMLPLAASLLVLAAREGENRLALFGVAATYGTCLWRGDSGAPLVAAQCILLVYWLLFEAFDMFAIRRNDRSRNITWVFPVNALAFLALSYHVWQSKDPWHLWAAAASGAGLFLLSSVVRCALGASRAADYELPAIVAAALMAGVLFDRVPEHFVGISWLALALLVFQFGVRLSARNLRLEAYLLTAAGILLTLRFHTLPLPFAVLIALAYALLMTSRSVSDEERRFLDWGLAIAITISGSVLAWDVTPSLFHSVALQICAVLFFSAGIYRWPAQLEQFSYAAAAVAFAVAIGTKSEVSTLGVISVVAYLAQWLSLRTATQSFGNTFWSLNGTIVLSVLLWREFPGGWLTTSWGIEGIALLAAGFPVGSRVLRLQGLALLLICILKLFLYDFRNLETPYRILSFVALGLILLLVSSIYSRFRERINRHL